MRPTTIPRVAVLCAALVGWPATATSQSITLPDADELIVGFVGLSVGVEGVLATVYNTIHVTRGQRAPLGWRVIGFATGGLWIAGCAYSAANVSPGDRGFRVGLMSVGLVFAGMALWATLLPERAPPRAVVTPSTLLGPLGSVGYGLTVAVTSF